MAAGSVVSVVALPMVEASGGLVWIRYAASGLATVGRISSHVASGAAIITISAAQASRYRRFGLVRDMLLRAAA